MLIFEIYDAENPLWVMKSWQNFAKKKCHQKVAAQNGFGTDSDIFRVFSYGESESDIRFNGLLPFKLVSCLEYGM